MKDILSPQVRAQELTLDPSFQLAIIEKNFAKIKEMIENKIRQAYIDYAFTQLSAMEQDLKNNKKFDMKFIKEMKDALNLARWFKPL